MSKPTLERPSPDQPRRGSWLSIFLALLAGSAAFAVLSFLTLGVLAPVLAIGGIVFALVGFHYCVWGWWLGRILRQAEEEQASEEED